MECDACGTPVYDSQQEQQLMQYDRTYVQAMHHLAAGNWEQTISLLQPLMNRYPTEKKLYLAVLRAATQDFGDVDMDNAAHRAVASEAWDKLARLNGVTGEMIRYGGQRYEKRREAHRGKRKSLLKWIFAAAFCSVMAGVLFDMEHPLAALLCTGGLIGFLYRASNLHPAMVIRQLTQAAPNAQSNPFL